MLGPEAADEVEVGQLAHFHSSPKKRIVTYSNAYPDAGMCSAAHVEGCGGRAVSAQQT